MKPALLLRLSLALLCGASLAGCTGAYHRSLEQRGMTKRDVLVRRIQHVQSAQDEAKYQLNSALESLRNISQVEPGRLREKHAELDAQHKNASERARDLRKRLPAVGSAATTLFKEWEKELALYQSPALRTQSDQQLATTRARYAEFIRAQESILAQIEPVLVSFRDQVLVIKHGLNPEARSDIDNTLRSLREELSRLIHSIDESTRAADAFIESLNSLD